MAKIPDRLTIDDVARANNWLPTPEDKARAGASYQQATVQNVAPAQEDNAFLQLSRALSTIEPAIRTASAQQHERYITDEEAAAARDFHEQTKRDAKESIKAGNFPPGASPFYQKAYKRLEMQSL